MLQRITVTDESPFRAAAWMIGAIVAFTSMAIAGRALAPIHDTFEIMTFRSFVGLGIVLIIGRYFGTLQEIRFRRIGLHVIRNASHFMGQNLWFFAITVVPLSQVFALEFTTPIWAMFLAAIFLKERLTLYQVTLAFIGFVGVLIVAKPGAGFVFSAGIIAAAIAAIGFAGAAISTRALTRTETITCILFYLTVIQAIFGLITMLYDGHANSPTWSSLPWLVLVGCAGLLAHFCLTKALSMAPAAVVMPIDFTRLPIIAVVGMLFYSEPLSWFVFLGAAIIFVANYLNIRAK